MRKFSKDQFQTLAPQYHIADVYLFGSQVSGFAREESDFDIAVRFQGGLPPAQKRGKIYGELYSDLVAVTREPKLDLVLLEEVPLHFQFKIITEGELLFSADLEDSCDFQERIINRYRDYKYFIDEYFEGLRVAPIA